MFVWMCIGIGLLLLLIALYALAYFVLGGVSGDDE